MKQVLFILGIVLISVSCTKHKGDMEDISPIASLVLENSAANKTYHLGDSITVQGLAISTATIHGYDLIIKKQSDTTTCYFLHVHEHNDTININKAWVNNIGGSHKMDAFIKLYLDHNGHELTAKTSFTIE